MCGILGIAGGDGPALLDRFIDDLRHRGPDDQRIVTTHGLSLGHRRLAIIGVGDEGRQPMFSRSRNSLLSFNGEIYNYLELADDLEAEGRWADRRSDTAILVEALEAWGIEALERLNGMFALAFFRLDRGSVLLARDRWGKKPLFWGRHRRPGSTGNLVFLEDSFFFGANDQGLQFHISIGQAF